MTITFFSNFLNHHQKPFCDLLHKRLGEDFKFVSCVQMPESFSKGGYEDLTKVEYNVTAFENEKKYAYAKELGDTSDIVIFGSANRDFVLDRMDANKHTFRYSERFFKKGLYQKYDYRILFHLIKYHTKYRSKNVYLLCASAFAANDFSWVRAYPNKMFKWGYFTKFKPIDIDGVLSAKASGKTRILFVARLIKLKHPELVIGVAEMLMKKGIEFQLDIVGSGPLEAKLRKEVTTKKLDRHVIFVGNLSNPEVLEKMRLSNMLVFTSDQNEGWGAVINEAMSNGCTVVAGSKIGSVPFLIKNDVTGMVFKSEDQHDFNAKVAYLAENRERCTALGKAAYELIMHTWSPKNAVENFIKRSDALLNNKALEIEEGPCSIAKPMPKNWFKQ